MGRAPAQALTSRDGEPGIRVWGEVPDVRPFLASADCVIAPLTLARGVQNKVLEAMAMARPVVLSQEAATGIDAQDGRDFAIGADDAALIAHVDALVGSSDKAIAMGNAARNYVLDHQSWEAMLAPLENIVGSNTSGGARDAA